MRDLFFMGEMMEGISREKTRRFRVDVDRTFYKWVSRPVLQASSCCLRRAHRNPHVSTLAYFTRYLVRSTLKRRLQTPVTVSIYSVEASLSTE
jgi:hypothetical protein